MSDLDTNLADLQAVVADFVEKHNRAVNSALVFATLADFMADTVLTPALADGAQVLIANYGAALLQKVGEGGDILKPSGDRWTVISRRASPRIFGATGDGVTDDETAIRAINQSANVKVIDLEGLTYAFGTNFFADSNAKVFVNGVIVAANGIDDFTPLRTRDVASAAEADALTPTNKLVDLGGLSDALVAAIAAIPPRNITQVAYSGSTVYTAAASIEIGELAASITTRKDNSKVLVTLTLVYERAPYGVFKLRRNGQEIGSNDGSASPHGRDGIAPVEYDPAADYTPMAMHLTYLDTVGPAGTYEYRLYCEGTSVALAINRPLYESAAYGTRGSSFLILEEIEVA